MSVFSWTGFMGEKGNYGTASAAAGEVSSRAATALFRSGTAAAFFYVSLGLMAVLWILPVAFLGLGDDTVVLRYNAYFGIDLTGSTWQTLLVPFMTTFFFSVNSVLAFLFARKNTVFPGTLLMVASFFLHVSALIALGALLLVN